MVTLRTASTSTSAFADYKGNNIYNKNNIREYNIVHGESIQVGKHCYLVCIPDLPNNVTKMEVARAVERRILYSSIGEIIHVKNVVFVEGFDEESKNAIENSCYKIAIVNIEMTPNEHEVYTDYENEFYESVCRGDLFIGEWRNVFLMANPNYYFKSSPAAVTVTAAEVTKKATIEAAFQKWKYGAEIENYECKVNSLETEIRELQNTVNEQLESLRFLSRKRSGEGLLGLKDASKSLSSFISTLNNKYARICVSDVEFLEINKNMKLKKMLGLVINVCDDCDACQELIHSLDYIEDERRRDLFVQIDKLICRINYSVRKFQLLHLHAERCIFGLKNRAVFTEFASFLNTAVEIVEEVTSRNCTHTQDVDFVKCYGIRATSKQQQTEWNPFTCADGSCVGEYGTPYSAGNGDTWSSGNGNNNGCYDYSEDADNVEMDMDEEMSSLGQMLTDFENKFAAAASVEQVKVDVEVKESQTVSTSTSSAGEDVKVAEVVIESEEVELVTTAEQEQETNDNNSKTKGKWFSWF